SMAGNAIAVRREFVSQIQDAVCSGDTRKETAAALKQIREYYGKAQVSLTVTPNIVLQDLNAGFAAARRGDAEDAIRLYGKALMESDSAPELRSLVRFSRANAYLGQRKYTEAIADYSEAIKLAPGD